MTTTIHNREELAKDHTDDDGFQEGFVRGYRNAVTIILEGKKPWPSAPDGRDGFDHGFNRGFRTAEEDIQNGVELRHPGLNPLP